MSSTFGEGSEPSGAPKRSARAAELDRAVEDVRERAASFAAMRLHAKAQLLRDLIPSLQGVADEWVAAACAAKGIDPASPVAAEERLGGPVVTIRNARLLEESLSRLARGRIPWDSQRVTKRSDERILMDVFPTSGLDAALFSGFRAQVLFDEATDEFDLLTHALRYSGMQGAGSSCLILGAGNVSSIPPMDVFYKMFVENATCVLKMNPVNEWLGPILEKGLGPLIAPGYLRIVYGGGEEGSYLCGLAGIDSIHITGSDRTHDLIVWGPPGSERDRRKAAGDPLLRKPITSELGNVSPVVVVPGPYTDKQLAFQARSVASMVGNNASFNCNAAKVIVTSKNWPQRETFLNMVASALAAIPPRVAYYPGARQRWSAESERSGAGLAPDGDKLPWLFIKDVDRSDPDEPLFRLEPFCAVLSETSLDAADAADFLRQATAFCNDRLWGTLNASIIVHPKTEKDPVAAHALDQAILNLRYGTVAINHWPGLAYGLVSPPWGGHPSATLENVQSGIGWVHNTFMLRNVEKTILRGPLVAKPMPAWFCGNPAADKVAVRLVDFEARPSWLKVPGIALAALKGK